MVWKQYENKDRGFRVLFPEQFAYSDWGAGTTTFVNVSQGEKDDFAIIITYHDYKDPRTFRIWTDKIEKNLRNSTKYTLLAANNITLSKEKYEALKLIYQDDKYSDIKIIVRTANRIYDFYCTIRHRERERYGILFEKMLSSVEFI